MIKKVLVLIVFAGYWTFPGHSQSPISGSEKDKEAIRQTALDYAEGLYGGDPAKIAKAVHPDFNKSVILQLLVDSFK